VTAFLVVTLDGKELKLPALEEKELDGFWRKIGEI
jgi:hypothetical protein